MAYKLNHVQPFQKGLCFICNEPCSTEAYCHYSCAVAFADAKKKRIKEAREKDKE